MVVGLEGSEENLRQEIARTRDQGVAVQPLERDVVRDEDRCNHTVQGVFDHLSYGGALPRTGDAGGPLRLGCCIACYLCVPACPSRAMQVEL